MRRAHGLALMVGAAILLVAGCGGKGGREPRVYTRPGPRDPVAEARLFFEGYAAGQGLGSEQELFEELITATKAVDTAKAAMIERAFAEIQKRPTDAATIAKQTLSAL